jgi:predicted deacetylase
MSAKYLIRLDDACPTMDSARWERIEKILDAYNISPVVAVVPDNKDQKLNIKELDLRFWDKVRSWQDKGWSIAMHGETHLMRPTDAEQILPFYKRSEFSGLSFEEQCQKISRSQAIFDKEGVRVETWIAPAHCFDWITVDALKKCTSIKIISDSIAANVYYEQGFYWIPQQLWGFRKMLIGLWTVCLHPNHMDDSAIDKFEQDIEKFSTNLVSFKDVTLLNRNRGIIDRLVNALFWIRRKQYDAALR